MDIRTRIPKKVRFSMASMTDIMFILLIFLLMTTRYHANVMSVDPPSSANKAEELDGVHITVTNNLKYYIEGQEVLFNQLKTTLQSQLEQKSNKIAILHMDKNLSIDHMVKVADIANQLGAHISLETKFNQKS